MSAEYKKAIEIIGTGIEQDIKTTEQMITLLADEKTALETKAIDTIEQLSNQKSKLSDNMVDTANARSKILSALALTNDEQGITELLEKENNELLINHWSQLKNNLLQCQTSNQVNSKIASRIHQSMQHLLKIVQGKSDKPTIYNPLGNSSAIVSGNLIGEA